MIAAALVLKKNVINSIAGWHWLVKNQSHQILENLVQWVKFKSSVMFWAQWNCICFHQLSVLAPYDWRPCSVHDAPPRQPPEARGWSPLVYITLQGPSRLCLKYQKTLKNPGINVVSVKGLLWMYASDALLQHLWKKWMEEHFESGIVTWQYFWWGDFLLLLSRKKEA